MMQDHGTANEKRKISARSSAREAFFIEFARVLRQKFPDLILMLTGGFRTRAGMQAALDENACDLVGLGRIAVANPAWPKENLDPSVSDEQAQLWLGAVQQSWLLSKVPIPVIGAGAESDYYSGQIKRMGDGLKPVAPGQ
jgi:2,4-dienoyl-CoA reductase-like NADH-dependent reductase (Old Yellow Enzyme family)